MRNKLKIDSVLSRLGVTEQTLREAETQDWDFPQPWAGKYSFSDLEYMRGNLPNVGFIVYERD